MDYDNKSYNCGDEKNISFSKKMKLTIEEENLKFLFSRISYITDKINNGINNKNNYIKEVNALMWIIAEYSALKNCNIIDKIMHTKGFDHDLFRDYLSKSLLNCEDNNIMNREDVVKYFKIHLQIIDENLKKSYIDIGIYNSSFNIIEISSLKNEEKFISFLDDKVKNLNIEKSKKINVVILNRRRRKIDTIISDYKI